MFPETEIELESEVVNRRQVVPICRSIIVPRGRGWLLSIFNGLSALSSGFDEWLRRAVPLISAPFAVSKDRTHIFSSLCRNTFGPHLSVLVVKIDAFGNSNCRSLLRCGVLTSPVHVCARAQHIVQFELESEVSNPNIPRLVSLRCDCSVRVDVRPAMFAV